MREATKEELLDRCERLREACSEAAKDSRVPVDIRAMLTRAVRQGGE